MSLRRADHSFRGVLPTVVSRCVWSRNLVSEEALPHWGLLRQRKCKYVFCDYSKCISCWFGDDILVSQHLTWLWCRPSLLSAADTRTYTHFISLFCHMILDTGSRRTETWNGVCRCGFFARTESKWNAWPFAWTYIVTVCRHYSNIRNLS